MPATQPAPSGDILIIDDEASVVEVVSLYLQREGFSVRSARNGTDALLALQAERPALVILDIMLPHIDGITLIRRMRETPALDVPVIMLTARGREVDRISGLELGADDYVTKPFSPAELVSRVKAVLRRAAGKTTEAGESPVNYEDLRVDPMTREVVVRGAPVELTATEFNLLWFMATRPRQVFKRNQLLENVWGFSDYLDPSTVTVHIRRLREKIELDPAHPAWLQTVWGVGYKFEPEASR
ncbi:MAG: response regulator transcription factor [Candidatus Promineofilum sp.]|nr:response regulator transcription factor [Promineifilum sp.]